MKRVPPLLMALTLVLILAVAGGLALSAPPQPGNTDPRPGSAEEYAMVELRRIERLAADPKGDPDKLWQELVDFRRCYPVQPQSLRAAALMSQVRSPLDALDRSQIPEEDRPGLPTDVVAVMGEQRNRHWGPVRDVQVSPDGKWILTAAAESGVRIWDTSTLRERRAFPQGACGAWSEDGKILAVGEWYNEEVARRLAATRKDNKAPPARRVYDIVRLYDMVGDDFKEIAALMARKRPERKDQSDPPLGTSCVLSVGLSSEGKRLIAVGSDQVVRVWDLRGKVPEERAAWDGEALGRDITILPGSRRLLVRLCHLGWTCV